MLGNQAMALWLDIVFVTSRSQGIYETCLNMFGFNRVNSIDGYFEYRTCPILLKLHKAFSSLIMESTKLGEYIKFSQKKT